MDLNNALQTYLEEARELLLSMESSLLRLEDMPDDDEAINATFRAAHTIKGSGGLFGLDDIVGFTHRVESVLDRMRNGELAITGDLVSLLLNCRDHLETLLGQIVERGEPLTDEHRATDTELVDRLKQYLHSADDEPESTGQLPKVGNSESERAQRTDGGSDLWHISIRFCRDCMKNGMDPASFIHFLGTVGKIAHLTTLLDAMPDAGEMDPQTCYLGCEIDLDSAASKEDIESVFEFIREGSILRILPPHSRTEDYIRLIQELPEEPKFLGEMLVASGCLTDAELRTALQRQHRDREDTGDHYPLGELLVSQKQVHKPVVAAALEKQKQIEEKRSLEHKMVKVHAEKLDELINLVGELVIAGASASLVAKRFQNTAFQEATSLITRLVEDIRDHALQLRMVEVGEVFNRFPRVVRDVSRELGKEIDLLMNGAETELDKSMVEKLSDPLMHLVRNAIDHGIEPLDVRRERGKPEKGTLRLSASHESGSIVIEVADDGGGLNRKKILAKALERGLVAPGASLADAEIYKLIMEPGFSTADQVSNLSGRGVGMDVVKRNIETLRGQIEIESSEGVGTSIRIRLPLTLAIIDGFLVGVGGGFYVLPLELVEECMERPSHQDFKGNYVNLRGEVLPFLNLGNLFSVQNKRTRRESIVVVNYGGKRAGLVVDELLGELQTVIKPLPKVFQQLRGIGGFSVMGSGDVAHVLDVPALMQIATGQEEHESHRNANPAEWPEAVGTLN